MRSVLLASATRPAPLTARSATCTRVSHGSARPLSAMADASGKVCTHENEEVGKEEEDVTEAVELAVELMESSISTMVTPLSETKG